jgi:hypothetical protein
MVSRPTSVTVIAWYLIGLSSLGALGYVTAIFAAKPITHEVSDAGLISPPIRHAIGMGGFVLDVVCGYFMLRGRNWSRYVYVGWSALHLAILFPGSSTKFAMIPGVAILAVTAVYLFRPAANTFFAAGGQNIDPRSIPSTRRMFGILFYFIAGFFFSCTGIISLSSFGVGVAKPLMLCVFLLPFAICLSIGRWLSAQETWKREIGTVILISCLAAIWMAIMMATMYANPEFNRKLRPERADLMSDYLFATIWHGAWLLLGGALLFVSRNDSARPSIPRPLAR